MGGQLFAKRATLGRLDFRCGHFAGFATCSAGNWPAAKPLRLKRILPFATPCHFCPGAKAFPLAQSLRWQIPGYDDSEWPIPIPRRRRGGRAFWVNVAPGTWTADSAWHALHCTLLCGAAMRCPQPREAIFYIGPVCQDRILRNFFPSSLGCLPISSLARGCFMLIRSWSGLRNRLDLNSWFRECR